MTERARASSAPSAALARNLAFITANRGVQMAGSLLFILLIPRRMGPALYGRFAFAVALILLLQMAGELGHQEVFSRFTPEAQANGREHVRRLFGGLLGVKIAAAVVCGLAAALIGRALADWLTPGQALLVGAAVALRILAWAPFQLLLGLGQAGRWSIESTWRQVVLIPLILLLALPGAASTSLKGLSAFGFAAVARDFPEGLRPFGLTPLRAKSEAQPEGAFSQSPGREAEQVPGQGLTGALFAFVAHEAIFCALAFVWTRGYLSWERRGMLRLLRDVRPYVRFGLGFFFANLAVVALFRLGPVLLEVASDDSRQVGYFDLAIGAYLLLYTLLSQVSYSLVPTLTQFVLTGRRGEAEAWLRRLARYATMVCVLAAGGAWLLAGTLAPLVFGADYSPAAPALRLAALGWLPLGMVWAGVVWSTVMGRPAVKFTAMMAGLLVFTSLCLALAGPRGAIGAAAAFCAGIVTLALAFVPLIGHVLRPAARSLALMLAVGALFAPLSVVRISPVWAAALVACAAVAYLAALFVVRAIEWNEVAQITRALRRGVFAIGG